MADLSQIPTDQLVKMLADHPAMQAPQGQTDAAPDPRDSSIMQRLATSIPVRAARGMMDPVMGGIQAVLHGAAATFPGADMKSLGEFDSDLQKGEQAYQGDRRATGQTGMDLPRIAGNIASPINFALPELAPLQNAGKLANGAVSLANRAVNGGVMGALQPVFDPANYGAEKAQQAALGAAGGVAAPIVGGAAKLGGKLLKGIVGETTGAGGTSLSNAYQAGVKGGDAGAAFTGSMRGEVPWTQVVDDAKSALGKLREQRGQAYRSGMVDVSKDATVLDFAPIDEAMNNAASIKNYKGQDLSPKTGDVRKEVQGALTTWKGLDPAEYHTPEGFDALKQQLGDIRDQHQIGTPQYKIASEAYNAVRGTIAKQAPAYNKVMSDYSSASDEITALEKELSLGKKVNPNTALRKLQSVMRDNANTSWGNRAGMANRLAEAGAPNLLPSLAGQALSTNIPRGLAKYADMAALPVAAFANPMTLLGLPAASPRAMGELAYGAGSGMRGLNNANLAVRRALPLLNRLPSLPPGILGSIAPNLLGNPAVNGAQ